jgi:hypothetical protein
MPVRPTLRCLTDDLGLKIPPLDGLLDELDHPLLRKANLSFQLTTPEGSTTSAPPTSDRVQSRGTT